MMGWTDRLLCEAVERMPKDLYAPNVVEGELYRHRDNDVAHFFTEDGETVCYRSITVAPAMWKSKKRRDTSMTYSTRRVCKDCVSDLTVPVARALVSDDYLEQTVVEGHPLYVE